MSTVKFHFVGCGDAFGSGGRLNTCFYVTSSTSNFLIDCGASSLIGLKRLNIDPLEIDTICLTHLHGDHFAGVIFFLMDARYLGHRTAPLRIIGPSGTEKRLIETMNCLYPGCWDKGYDFDLEIEELDLSNPCQFAGVTVYPFAARHLQDGNDFILRFEMDGKTVVYSGDTGWTETLPKASKNADLMVLECFSFDKVCDFHLDYKTITARLGDLGSRQLILTHLGPDALTRMDDMTLDVAHDGRVVVL